MSFGRQPVSQVFHEKAAPPKESFFELAPAVCAGCGLFQLLETPPPTRLFHEAYPFRTGTSRRMADHFKTWAESLAAEHRLDEGGLVVELGCNDGTMLRHLARPGGRHLGVEPARHAAATAQALGLDVVPDFFSEDLARRLRRKHGPARLIVAANVLAHIPDLQDLCAGLSHLLADDGVLTFEVIYLVDMLEKTAFDQLYDEHVFTWSVTSVARAFGRRGLEVVHAETRPTHGGSLRLVVAPAGTRKPSRAVESFLETEQFLGLDQPATYAAFRSRCERTRDALRQLLHALCAQGRRLAAYGATAKSTTLLNYCRLDPSLIEFIVDNTPEKQGRLSPGTHIPVVPPRHFTETRPDYALLLAWNHRLEIEQKEQEFHARGGRWITYVPDIAII